MCNDDLQTIEKVFKMLILQYTQCHFGPLTTAKSAAVNIDPSGLHFSLLVEGSDRMALVKHRPGALASTGQMGKKTLREEFLSKMGPPGTLAVPSGDMLLMLCYSRQNMLQQVQAEAHSSEVIIKVIMNYY